jgi:hypothetical protein
MTDSMPQIGLPVDMTDDDQGPVDERGPVDEESGGLEPKADEEEARIEHENDLA